MALQGVGLAQKVEKATTIGGKPVVNVAAPPRPAKQAAASRVQRYWNAGTGKMEAPHKGFEGHRSGGGGRSSGGGTHGGGGTPVSQPVSFINMTPREIEARARSIVQSELGGLRAPYQQQQGLLGQEQTSALQTNATQYGKLAAGVQRQQGEQATSAKTFENYAADALNKAQQAVPGATPGQSEITTRQQEADRTLLTGIAAASQAGTQARQQSENQWLANLAATVPQAQAEVGRTIEGQFGKQKADVAGKEAALIAKSQGTQAKLAQTLFGEQEKDRIAAGGLNVKLGELANKTQTSNANAAYKGAQTKAIPIKLGNEGKKIAQGAKKLELSEDQWRTKKKGEEAKTKYYEARAKALLEGGPVGGKPLTTKQKGDIAGEAGKIFGFIQGGVTRQEIENGFVREPYKATNSKGEKYTKYATQKFNIKNPILVQVAEESIHQGYVSAATKALLREKGINDTGWSNLLYQGAGKTRPNPPVTGNVYAPKGKSGHRGR